MSICFVCDSSIVATFPSIPAARFAFCCFGFVVRGWFLLRTKAEPRVRVGHRKPVQAPPPLPHPSNFIADRPKAALLFGFFGDFRCGVPLFIVILVIYKYKNSII